MIHNQYVIVKNDGFLKGNGKVASTIERAHIVPTKKLAQELVDKYGGEIIEVYLSLTRPKPIQPLESVYLIKKVCVVYGLTIYGPFFTLDEAINVYNNELERDCIFPYKEELCYAQDGQMKRAANKLGDELTLCRINRAKI